MKSFFNGIGFMFRAFWKVLTEPFITHTKPEDHRRAIVTTAFLLFSFIAVGLEQMTAGNTPFVALVSLAIGYFLARTYWYKLATLILLATLTIPSYLVAISLPNPDPNRMLSAFAWIILPLILSSLIYSTRSAVIYAVINIFALAALPSIRPELNFGVIGAPLGFYVLATLFTIIVMAQRNELEKDRQYEIIESHNKLNDEVELRKRFAAQSQRRADQLAMLNEISRVISKQQGLDEILDSIFFEVKRIISLDVFYVALYDEKIDTVSFPILYDNNVRRLEKTMPLEKINHIARVIRSKQALILNRTLEQIEESEQNDSHLGNRSHASVSALMVPLLINNQTIGVISTQSYNVNAYNDEHLMLLTAIAQQVVTAIQSSHLLEETKKNEGYLAILNELGRAVSELQDLPELLEVIYRQVKKRLSTDVFFIGLHDPETGIVSYPIMYDEDKKYQSETGMLSPKSSLYLMMHGQSAELILRTPNELITPINQSHMVGNTSKRSASLMFAPLKAGNLIIGIISVQSYTLNAYTEDDLNLLVGIGNQVGVAIENSQLYESVQQEIKERLKVEEQLRAAESRYRELVESLPVVVYSAESGAHGRWFYVSPQIKTMLGFEPEEWVNNPSLWYQQIHPDDQKYAATSEDQLTARGSSIEMEYRMVAKDGHILWIHDESINVSISEDQKMLVQGIMMDITARKQAELFLKESEERYHKLFETAHRQTQELSLLSTVQSSLASEIDLDTLFHSIVENVAKTFGYSFVSVYILKDNYLQLKHQVGYDDENVIERISPNEGVSGRVISTGLSILIEDVSREPDFLSASPHIQSEICVPLFDGDEICGTFNVESGENIFLGKNDLRLLNTLADQINIAIRRARLYSERDEGLQREQLINDFAHTISSTLELPVILERTARFGVILTGAETGTVTLMSKDGAVITNVYSYNEDPSIEQIIPRGQGLTWLTYERGRPVITDNYTEHPNAIPDWSASGLRSFMGVPIIASNNLLGVMTVYRRNNTKKFSPRDLSMFEALAKETAIAIQNAQLFETLQKELADHKQTLNELENKNAELERFTYTVSHDLKSPIVTIGGFLGFLEEDLAKERFERIPNTINRVREAAKKMERLLNELLELSRIGRLINPPKDVPFMELVEETLELVHGQLDERQVEVKVDAEFPIVHVDKIRMIEVLQNLIVNAIKFTDEQEIPIIEIGLQQQNDEEIFFVKDNGMGVAPEFHERIFGLFNKLDPASDGTGIGLALVKRIIEVHGGRIWVESEVGKGATFYFTLKNQQENL